MFGLMTTHGKIKYKHLSHAASSMLRTNIQAHRITVFCQFVCVCTFFSRPPYHLSLQDVWIFLLHLYSCVLAGKAAGLKAKKGKGCESETKLHNNLHIHTEEHSCSARTDTSMIIRPDQTPSGFTGCCRGFLTLRGPGSQSLPHRWKQQGKCLVIFGAFFNSTVPGIIAHFKTTYRAFVLFFVI